MPNYTLHVEREAEVTDLLERVHELVKRALSRGRDVTVTITDQDDVLSPQQAAVRLGFSRQHVNRLIEAGELRAEQLPHSRYWKIPLPSLLEFEERRERAREQADEHSRSLDKLGAPAE